MRRLDPQNPTAAELAEAEVDLRVEVALAAAQGTIARAMETAGVSKAELARRMGIPTRNVTRFLSGGHNLTIRTLARALAACGYEMVLDTMQTIPGVVRSGGAG